MSRKQEPINQAPKVRVPRLLLTEIDRVAARHPMKPSRTQMVALALRQWLDAQQTEEG